MSSTMKWCCMNRPRQRSSRGAVMVEFALTVMMLVALVFGITELGRALYQWNTLTKAAEVGVRFLSRAYDQLDPLTCAPKAGWASSVTKAKNLVVYGQETETPPARLPGLTPDNVSVQVLPYNASFRACPLRIDVTGVPFDSPALVGLFGFNITLSAHAEERYIGE